jgi:hypothetical protein
MRMNLTLKDIERFWPKVDRSGGPDACWPYVGCRDAKGYGKFSVCRNNNSRSNGAHRVSWVIQNGEIPDETPVIMHACDNPPCCNPNHLNAGTRSENNTDCATKGRHRAIPPVLPGAISPHAKLTEPDVIAIRSAFANREGQAELAIRFGVTQSAISLIVNYKTWKNTE